MKKLFTMIFALCISLGAWAGATLTENRGLNTTENAAGCLNITTTAVGDINTSKSTISNSAQWFSKFFVVGPVGDTDITALNEILPANSILDLTLATGLEGSWISNIASPNIIGLGLPIDFDLAISNSNLKFVYSSAATGIMESAYNEDGGVVYNVNILKDGGLTSFLTLQDIYYLQYRTVNLSGKAFYTDAELESLKSLEGENSKGVTVNEVVVVKSYTAVGGQVADNLANETSTDITALKVTGTLTSGDISWMSGHLKNLTKLDLTEATLAGDADLTSLSTLKGLKVSSTFDDSNVNIPSLDYIYTVRVSKVKIVTPGSMAAAIADNSDDAAAATSVTVTGTLNGDDLAAMSGFEAVTLLNLSGITVESSSSITSLDAKGTAAILLPSSVTEAELGSLQAKTVTENNNTVQKYHCLAYFEDVTNLNIYAFDGAVGRLGTFVNPGVTAITFIPRYDTNGVFYSADSEHGFIGRSREEMNLFRAQLKNLPAISMDLSILNHKYMYADFTEYGLSPYTHYLTLFGNINPNSSGDPYIADYDFTNENSTSIKYPSTVWVVSTFKDDEAFVLDENGNKILISGSEEGGDAVYQRTGAATNVHYGGSRFLAATEPTNLIYIRDHVTAAEGEEVPSSLLEGAKNYFHGDQLYATRQIFMGDLNENEIRAINNDIHGDYFDFMYGANFTETNTIVGEGENAKALESVVKLHNDNVKYILLPSGHEYNINSTSADVCSFSDCGNNLLCVGALTGTELTTWSRLNTETIEGVERQIESVQAITDIVGDKSTITSVNMSGYLCQNDIRVQGGEWNDDLNKTLHSALDQAHIQSADFTNAVFYPNTDMIFSNGELATNNLPNLDLTSAKWYMIYLESIKFPTSSGQTIIPPYCLDNSAYLTEICIPSNITDIQQYAFHGTGATHIYTTAFEGDDFRDDENVYDHGIYTITLSSNLKNIKAGAFCTGNEKWTDVYCLAKDAPTCAAGAFNSMNTYADNTYAGLSAHPVERANYKKSATQLMTVLHYPVTCTEDEAKNYTDITREYSLIDETGAYDGEGNLMRWPNQSEFMRSFNQAVAGLTWTAWNVARIPAGAPTANELLDTGLYGGGPYDFAGTTYVTKEDTQDDYHISTGWDGQILKTYTPSFTIDNDNDKVYDYNNYRGWHEFVLCQSVSVDRIIPKNPTTYVQGDWYTLCLPYDLTREQVLSLIGIPKKENVTVTYAAKKGYQAEDGSWFPQVYTLTGVTRKYPTITLTFSQELMRRLEKGKGDVTFNDANSTTAASPVTYKPSYDYSEEETNGKTTAGSNNKIYLKGGFPYLVRPILPQGVTIDGTLGQYMLKVGSFDKENLGHQASVANGTIAAPIVNQKFIARNGTAKIDFKVDEETTSKYYYYFVGTYTEEMIPAYAYHLSGGSWSRTEDESKIWKPFTAIIGGKCTDEGAVYETDNPNYNGTNSLTTYYVSLKNQDDNFVTAGQHNIQYLITFEDEEGEGEVVAIDKIDGRDINNAISSEGNVYNMTGQFVGNSLNGLAKGIYLVNGKKVLVK